MEWFYSEPFSLRPLRAATYAASIIDNYSEAEKFARLGLNIDRSDVELGNNLVYALACQDKFEEAQQRLHEILSHEKNSTGKASYHTVANFALLHYRAGLTKEGENLYRLCLSMLEDSNHSESRALATVTMAKEALLANAPNASELLEEAKKITSSSRSNGAIKMLERITNIVIVQPKKLEIQMPTWMHDNVSNTLIVSKAQPFKVR